MHALMTELGHERYGVQGGDWGSIVGARLAHQQPQAVLGLHLNFPAGIVQRQPGEELPAEEVEWREQMAEWRDLEGAYGHIQGTKPQTLAYSLNDSPVGLLAWILEKFEAWSEPGGLWETFDRDAVLANVTLYWLTGTALSAARTYYESRRESPPFRAASRPPAPMAFARFRGEPWTAPRPLVERSFNLVRWSEPERGGHFAAMEQPQLFAEDVAAFFAEVAEGEA
ncbi:MAG: alpha/beta hydrolase [Acidimicrobiia bacterium]|nr:alpha/beta hydrolase [Acidimicrobiia bacterium]